MFKRRNNVDTGSTNSGDLNRTPKHERTPNVWGQWLTVPKEQRNIHQKVAYWTGGLATLANVATGVGFAAVHKGSKEYEQGNHAKGVLYMALGRPFDLLDGHLAHRYGVKSKPGALGDAFVDKAAIGLMAKAALNEKAIGPAYGATVVVGQVAMAGYNIGIGIKGGDPNPSGVGKFNMAFTGTAITASMLEQALEPHHEEAAAIVRGIARFAKAASIITTAVTVWGYKEQYDAFALAGQQEAAMLQSD